MNFLPSRWIAMATTGVVLAVTANLASAASLKAEYLFNNTLSSSTSGAPTLGAVTASGASAAFVTDNVFGNNRTVYSTSGSSSFEAGLSLDTTGLVANNNYSVEMVFSVTGGYPYYKRLLQAGTNDNGLYIGPGDTLNTYVGGPHTGLSFAYNTYHHLVASVASGGQTEVWLDGSLSHSLATNALNITSGGDLLSFYLDGNGEYTNAKTALIRLWDAPLTNAEVTALNTSPLSSVAPITSAVPEPQTYALLLAGLGLIGAVTRRRAQRESSGV